MRTKFHLLAIAALCLLAGACVPFWDNQLLPQEENQLTATILSEPMTRTILSSEKDGASKVLWAANDAIGVFLDGSADPSLFHVVSGAGSSRATFSGTGRGSSYIAVYPYDIITSLNGESVSVELPSVQTYTKSSFQNGAYPMVAVSSSSELSFRNLCAVLKVSMTGHHNVTRLIFRANDSSVKVCGPATVSLSDPAGPVLTVSKSGCDSLIVETGGVQLESDRATDFYLVLPAQAYKGGFTVRVETSTGYMVKTLDSDFTMVRAQKHDAKPFAVKLDEGIDPSVSLAGSGSESDPFQIGDLGDLLLMQGAVNGDGALNGVDATTAYYRLVDDLDMRQACSESLHKSWDPIGTHEHPFKGRFDGAGHLIRNLYIDNENDYQGLFGVLERNSESILNLTVDGFVRSRHYAGLIAGYSNNYYTFAVSGCLSTGNVEALSGYVGGILGHGGASDCENRATVIGYGTYVGGIVGSSDFVFRCINNGSISNSSPYTGGIVGYQNAGFLIDCINNGSVSNSSSYTGGIAGYARQGSKLYNNLNRGTVYGSRGFVGGICGCTSNNSSSQSRPVIMQNCLNLGKASAGSQGETSYCGAITGYYGAYNDYEFTNGYGDVIIRNCYWLYDETKSLGMATGIGAGNGILTDNRSLSDGQIKGERCESALYYSKSDDAYFSILEALNACAYDLQVESKYPLSRWDFDSNGYPAVSDLGVQKPGDGSPVFEISADSFSFRVSGGKFDVSVTSSLAYEVAGLPDWVTETSSETLPNKPHTRFHTFMVSPNETGGSRQCVISFTNAEGTTRKVTVNQTAPYLTVSGSEIIFTATGGQKRVQISSSIDWKANSTGADWFTFSPKQGAGDGSISIQVQENSSATARSASLVISSEENELSRTVTIIQSGKSGEESEAWKEYPFYHQSVAMRFTATWCGWCPYMNTSISKAQALYPDKIQHLALHGGGSDLEFAPTATLQNQYHVNGFPTGIVDGRILVNNGTDTDAVGATFVAAAKETEELYGTVSGMAIRSSVSGKYVSIDVDAYFKEGGDYKITVLLLEDGIIHEQSGGSSNYVHDNVARVSATEITGDPFTAGDMTRQSFSYNVSVPNECKVENMRVLAYIHRKFSGNRKQSGDYGDYFIDNCATAAVGDVLTLALVGGSGESGGGGGGDGKGNEGITPGGEIK